MTSDPGVAIQDVRVDGRRIVLEPHNCFACGTLNTHGLQLDLHAGGERCWAELALDPRFEGWAGIAHGGIISTILDEVMAWALVGNDLWGVTARMTVDFRRPVPVGRPIRGEGRVLEVRRRIVETEGVIVDAADGTLLARAAGTYVVVPESRRRELRERYRFRLVPETVADSPSAKTYELPDIVDVG